MGDRSGSLRRPSSPPPPRPPRPVPAAEPPPKQRRKRRRAQAQKAAQKASQHPTASGRSGSFQSFVSPGKRGGCAALCGRRRAGAIGGNGRRGIRTPCCFPGVSRREAKAAQRESELEDSEPTWIAIFLSVWTLAVLGFLVYHLFDLFSQMLS